MHPVPMAVERTERIANEIKQASKTSRYGYGTGPMSTTPTAALEVFGIKLPSATSIYKKVARMATHSYLISG